MAISLENIQLDKQKKILVAVFVFLIAYLDVAFIIKAQNSGIRKAGARIAKLGTDLAITKAGIQSMNASREGSGQKVSAPTRLLNESRISELVQEIAASARRLDISIGQIRPNRLEQKSKVPGQEKFIPVAINLDMTGSYHNLGRFIQEMEAQAIFTQVEEINISAQMPDLLKQKITLVLKTYVTK